MVMKIEVTVMKIERLIQRCNVGGRLYMAFNEPEIQGLLDELERAKSSMSFAYMSYCQYVIVTGRYIEHRLIICPKLVESQRSRQKCCFANGSE
jgi:hypothetical protein